jgi:hypothetical protein
VGAVAVERSAAAGRRRRRCVRIGRTVMGETVMTVWRTASLRVVSHSSSDAHTSVMMEMLTRLIQRKTLHPQIELLMTPWAVRRCENPNAGGGIGWTSPAAHVTWERLMDPIRAEKNGQQHSTQTSNI